MVFGPICTSPPGGTCLEVESPQKLHLAGKEKMLLNVDFHACLKHPFCVKTSTCTIRRHVLKHFPLKYLLLDVEFMKKVVTGCEV